MARPVSFSRRLADLAAHAPDRPALVFVAEDGTERTLTRGELGQESAQWARRLRDRGVTSNSLVLVALPNSVEHVLSCLAAWQLGALVVPVNAKLPPWERDQIVDAAAESGRDLLVIGAWELTDLPPHQVTVLTPASLATGPVDDAPLPDRIAHPGKGIGSGGATGRSKLIVDPNPWVYRELPAFAEKMGLRAGQTQLVGGPLYHGGPFAALTTGLQCGHTIVLLERFRADLAIDAIERHRVNWFFMVPTQIQRILELPDIDRRDLSSVEAMEVSGAFCPAHLKRAWMDLLGPERVWELYGANDGLGITLIRGDEWMQRPGSVGRPVGSQILILDEHGNQLPPGAVGEIYLRPLPREGKAADPRSAFYYLGSAPPRSAPDGYESAGDLGWCDQDGYLFLADRRTDLIITGGVNVYPAEVEAALAEHPQVDDVAVVGVPDPRWGKRVQAIVSARNATGPELVESLDRHCRERLAPAKVPKAYEFVETFPRSDAGKIRRSELAAERQNGGHNVFLPAAKPDGR